jgi:hypothetical protein
MPGLDANDATTVAGAMARVIWAEFVIERRRHSVAEQCGWPRPGMDREFLVEKFDDYVGEYEPWLRWAVQNDQIPIDLPGSWQLMVRGVVVTYAHAKAGDADEERQIESFLDRQSKQIQAAWLDVMGSCDEAFQHPNRTPEQLDALGEEAWWRIHNALAEKWNRDFTKRRGAPV